MPKKKRKKQVRKRKAGRLKKVPKRAGKTRKSTRKPRRRKKRKLATTPAQALASMQRRVDTVSTLGSALGEKIYEAELRAEQNLQATKQALEKEVGRLGLDYDEKFSIQDAERKKLLTDIEGRLSRQIGEIKGQVYKDFRKLDFQLEEIVKKVEKDLEITRQLNAHPDLPKRLSEIEAELHRTEKSVGSLLQMMHRMSFKENLPGIMERLAALEKKVGELEPANIEEIVSRLEEVRQELKARRTYMSDFTHLRLKVDNLEGLIGGKDSSQRIAHLRQQMSMLDLDRAERIIAEAKRLLPRMEIKRPRVTRTS